MAAEIEEINIVEFYPEKFHDSESLIANGLNRHKCHLMVEGIRFTRTVYRPLIGPDILMAQSKGECVFDYFSRLPKSAASSRLSLYNSILEHEAMMTNGRFTYYRNSNPGWTWENVADSVSRFVESKGYFIQGIQPKGFGVTADEAYGKLSIMSEAAGWKHMAPRGAIDIVEVPECCICFDEMTPDDSIALHCQHVYHKRCFLPALWENPVVKCWICNQDLFLF